MIGVNAARPDITLVLDNDGVITEATLANSISEEAVTGWLGRPWFETVGDPGTDDVRRMVDDARSTGLSAFGQVVQHFPSGRELPIEYATARLAGRPGLVAIGKNLQAVAELHSRLLATQQAREQESWKLREIETRYRLLFDRSMEAVLIVHAESLRISELNASATRDLGFAQEQDLLAEVPLGEQAGFLEMLGRVREQGRSPGIIIRLGGQRTWSIRASLLTSEPGSAFLLQLAAVGRPSGSQDRGTFPVPELIDRLPDGFVVLDGNGVVRQANDAFLGLVQAANEGQVLGQKLSTWLALPGADTSLLSGVQRHRAVRHFPTTLQGEFGSELAVELVAVGDQDTNPKNYGVLVRDVSRRAGRQPDDRRLSTALSQVGAQSDTASLMSVVRDTVEVVERHYITEALARVGGNRTAAAEILGMSRQSLHAKLNRYGLDGNFNDSE